MLTLLSQVAPEVVVMTSYGATNEDEIGIMKILGCQRPRAYYNFIVGIDM